MGDNLAAPIKMEDTIPLAQQLHFKEFILKESTHLSVKGVCIRLIIATLFAIEKILKVFGLPISRLQVKYITIYSYTSTLC